MIILYQNLKIILLILLLLMSLFYSYLIYIKDDSLNEEMINRFENTIKQETLNSSSLDKQKIQPHPTGSVETLNNKEHIKPLKNITNPQISIPEITPINTNTNHLNDLENKHSKSLKTNRNPNKIKEQLIEKERAVKANMDTVFNNFQKDISSKIRLRESDFLEFKTDVINNMNNMNREDKIKTSL